MHNITMLTLVDLLHVLNWVGPIWFVLCFLTTRPYKGYWFEEKYAKPLITMKKMNHLDLISAKLATPGYSKGPNDVNIKRWRNVCEILLAYGAHMYFPTSTPARTGEELSTYSSALGGIRIYTCHSVGHAATVGILHGPHDMLSTNPDIGPDKPLTLASLTE